MKWRWLVKFMFQLHAQMGRESLVARKCEVVTPQMPSHLERVKLFIQLISIHIIVYTLPTHTSDCSTCVLWSWVEGFLSACSCASTLIIKHKTFVWICQIYAFRKIMSHISKVYSSIKWLPQSGCLYCWQMAGHIYFSMMKHMENLCESDIVHSVNYYYNQLHSPTDAHNKT